MHTYQSQYSDLGFERAGLFRAILNRYPCREVLYPGCSVHITPSFFFPHVVYVDKGEWSARFFAGENSVLDYINRHKQYKQSAYVRFIEQDYLEPLPLLEANFDLVLALFAGGIARSCKKHLKKGGLLISNNHQNDAVDALRDEELRLIARIDFRSGRYVVVEHDLDSIQLSQKRSHKNALRNMRGTTEYADHETYYVFKRK